MARWSKLKGNPKPWLLLLLVPLLGLGTYLLWHCAWAGAASAPERKVLFYQDSMHPWVKSDHPGKCTIYGMDLTPLYAGQTALEVSNHLVVLSANNITVLNVQTEAVRRRALGRSLRVAGTLEANETRKAVVSAPSRARIEALAVDYAGVEVEQGQKLVTLFSPDVGALQRVLFSARPPSERTNVAQVRLASESYVAHLSAPLSGVVLERNIYNGQYVAEGDRLLTIADASVLWFRFDVYESQLPWFKLGQNLEVTVSAVPGKVFPATISFIEPTLNDATRTVKIRAEIKNPVVPDSTPPRRLLRFGMYAEGRVRAAIADVLTVPRTAILFPGTSAYAYVDNGEGAYERRRVKVGRQGDTVWEVLEGLAEGERVVSAGNVLLDAQAQFAQGGPPDEPAPGGAEPGAEEVKLTLASSTAASLPESHCATPAPVGLAPPKHMEAAKGEGLDAVAVTSPPQPPTVTNSAASSAFKEIVAEAGEISRALAADDVAQFNEHVARLPALLAALQPPPVSAREEGGLLLQPPHGTRVTEDLLSRGGVLLQPRHGARVEEDLAKRLSVISQGAPAKDLTEARARFLPFSTAMVELAQQLKKQEPAFSALKIYHCPMAPKPGLWLQSQGPLANPFFGSAMLHCGKEVP